MINAMVDWKYLKNKKFPLLFHGIVGKDERESNSPSYFNTYEIKIVLDYVKKLKETLQDKDIVVVTPYKK